MRIDISDGQLDQNLEYVKTLCRLDLQFHQNNVQSFISFGLRLNLDFHSELIILNEYRGIMDEYALNRAANLLPRDLFVVELESYGKHDHFVNVDGDVPLFCQSLKIVCAARCLNCQGHFPVTYPKLIFSSDADIVWRVYVQERGICKTQPERSTRQVKQGAFACSEISFYGSLVKEGDSLALASCACQG